MTQPDPAIPPTPNPMPGDPANPPEDRKLNEPGLSALAEERAARRALELRLKPLEALAQALDGRPTGEVQTDFERLTERLATQEAELAQERAARFRTEVALEKKLTPEQAALLAGATREELAAHADRLIAVFGKPAETSDPAKRTQPRPDPAQGAQPGAKPSARDAAKAEAARRFPKPTT
jgi:hypothetical protein